MPGYITLVQGELQVIASVGRIGIEAFRQVLGSPFDCFMAREIRPGRRLDWWCNDEALLRYEDEQPSIQLRAALGWLAHRRPIADLRERQPRREPIAEHRGAAAGRGCAQLAGLPEKGERMSNAKVMELARILRRLDEAKTVYRVAQAFRALDRWMAP